MCIVTSMSHRSSHFAGLKEFFQLRLQQFGRITRLVDHAMKVYHSNSVNSLKELLIRKWPSFHLIKCWESICARILWNVCFDSHITCSCQTSGSMSNFVSTKTTRPKHETHHHGIMANCNLSCLDDHPISGSWPWVIYSPISIFKIQLLHG